MIRKPVFNNIGKSTLAISPSLCNNLDDVLYGNHAHGPAPVRDVGLLRI
jgi:hypothetical protein